MITGSPEETLPKPPEEILFEGPVIGLERPKRFQHNQGQLVRNPIQLALEYHKALHSGKYKTKQGLAKTLNVTRVRVVQILNLLKLDSEVIHKILSLGDPQEHSNLTERKLRPLTQVKEPMLQMGMLTQLLERGEKNE